jgi:hypothetical protein
MKAIIEIELGIDGEWEAQDEETLVDMILENPHHGGWMVNEDRLYVVAESMTCEIKDIGGENGQ